MPRDRVVPKKPKKTVSGSCSSNLSNPSIQTTHPVGPGTSRLMTIPVTENAIGRGDRLSRAYCGIVTLLLFMLATADRLLLLHTLGILV